jgi:uridine phosphorylase
MARVVLGTRPDIEQDHASAREPCLELIHAHPFDLRTLAEVGVREQIHGHDVLGGHIADRGPELQHAIARQAVVHSRTCAATEDEACFCKHVQMLRGVRDALPDLRSELVDVTLALCEHIDELGAPPVPQRLRDRGERTEEGILRFATRHGVNLSIERLNVGPRWDMLRVVNLKPADATPLLSAKQYHEASVFTASNLLREGRRQRGLADVEVPAVCILDPDGDLHRYLHATGLATGDDNWACYHTTLSRCTVAGREVGIVPFAVGAPFAVLVAEELAASGCSLVINLTSAGRVAVPNGLAAFVVIERALRDEGTSLHYLPPAPWSRLRVELRQRLADLTVPGAPPILHGSTWTTDAPFRETAADVARHRAAGILGVEMEAAALYAYAEATGNAVLCLAHLTNELGGEGDFEKGASDGAEDALRVIEAVLHRLD